VLFGAAGFWVGGVVHAKAQRREEEKGLRRDEEIGRGRDAEKNATFFSDFGVSHSGD